MKVSQALEAWVNILGSENVLTSEVEVTPREKATFATTQKIIGVIKPSNRQEVQTSVKIANQYKITIYPISCGKNWGLGSRVPVQSNSIIIDLSRMNQIIDYSEKLAYVTVEPGVTFRQLYEYLQQHNSNLLVSEIGGSPEASLIGNALERGDGAGPCGDRSANSCALEVVLPTGEFIQTGFRHFAQAKTASIYKWGVGPCLDGLFSQSNLGIVTQMTLFLAPKPNYFQTFFCTINQLEYLEKLLDNIQNLISQGVINENCFCFWNCYKFLAIQGRYPWKIMKGKTPFSLKELKGVEPWLGRGELYSANYDLGLAKQKIIEKFLAGLVDQLEFQEHNQPGKEPSFTPPNDENIKSTYWRKKIKVPAQRDPDRDNCGVIWLCLILPFEGKDIITALKITEAIFKHYQFEPNIALNCQTSRHINLFAAIMYDREVLGEDERAMECHDETLHALTEAGYIPYRLGIQSMDALPPFQDDSGQLIKTIKKGLDPNDILAPGRYDFRREWN
ncbi:MAG: FAD-binding oxidoreductase [Moorea sp. SIO4A3]|nr:FAD-binding oxidoreductase [Moorena sp. SIO4A3]